MNKEPIEIYVPISVEDRLPDKVEYYYTIDSSGYEWFILFNGKEFQEEYVDVGKVTHWYEKQSKIILSQEEWDGLQREIQSIVANNNPYSTENQSLRKEIERLKGLLATTAKRFYQNGMQQWVSVVGSKRLSTTEDFIKFNKELADQFTQFKKENSI